MNKIFLNNIGDLAETTRASYTRFILKGITEELFYLPIFLYTKQLKKKYGSRKKSKYPYYIDKDISVNNIDFDTIFIKHHVTKTLLYKNEIKFKFSGINVKHAYLKKKNYSIELFIKGKKLLNKNSGHRIPFIETYFFLGTIPLLTKEGTFIVNGCERVIINQNIKSPGIFFKKIIKTKKDKNEYIATIISKDSKHTNISFKKIDHLYDKDYLFREREHIYIKLNYFSWLLPYQLIGKPGCDSSKLYLFDIIKYFLGDNHKAIFDFKYSKQLANQRLTQKYDNNGELLSSEKKDEISNTMQNIIEKIYLTRDSNFFIGEIGRYNLNKKLGLELPKNITNLTYLDFIRIIEILIELKYFGRPVDDIDHLKEKKIKSLGKFLQLCLKETFVPIIDNFLYTNKKIREFKSPTFYIKSFDFFNNSHAKSLLSIKFFRKMHKKLELKKKNFSGLSQHIKGNVTLSLKNRYLKNSKMMKTFKSSILSNSLAQYMDQTNPLAESTQKRRLSILGPFGLKRECVPKGIRDIHPSRHGKICIIETPEGKNAGLITSISMHARSSSYGWLEAPYFLLKDRTVLKKKKPIYLSTFEDSYLSISFADVSLNKLNSINQKSLSVRENYYFNIKKTNLVKFLIASQMQIVSLGSSLVPFVEHNDASRALMGSNMQRQAVPLILPEMPLIGTNLESAASADSGMTLKSYSEGLILYTSSKKIFIKDKNGFVILYNLKKYKRSNQHASFNQKPCVWVGETVFSNQVIADGPSTCHGELALGRNLIVAYMPWEGYNFEDSILINENLAHENLLTSIHINEYSLILKDYNLNFDILTNKSPYNSDYLKRHLNKNGVARLGSYIYGNDILIGKLTKILDYQPSPEESLLASIFGTKLEANFKDSSLHLPINIEGRIIGIKILKIFKRKLKKKNKKKLISKKFRIFLGITRKIAIGDKLSGRHGNKGIISKIMKCHDMPYLLDGTSVDIILNPLGVPSRMNIGQIFECLLGLATFKLKTRIKIAPFDEIYGVESSRVLVYQKLKESAVKSQKNWVFNALMPGKTYARDGRTGIFFDNPITIGKSYILKLIHIVEEKIHTRSTGVYSSVTSQPLHGKTSKGGQRFGEMETWALEAHGCSYILKELLTLKSDDIDGRLDAHNAIILNNKKSMGFISDIFLILIKELNSIGLYFSAFNIKNGFYTTSNIKIKEKNFIKSIEKRLKLQDTLKKNLIFCH